jgi:hypothetical protein
VAGVSGGWPGRGHEDRPCEAGLRLVSRNGDDMTASYPEQGVLAGQVGGNDAGSALGGTRGYGLAGAVAGSGHERNPSGVGFRGPVWGV